MEVSKKYKDQATGEIYTLVSYSPRLRPILEDSEQREFVVCNKDWLEDLKEYIEPPKPVKAERHIWWYWSGMKEKRIGFFCDVVNCRPRWLTDDIMIKHEVISCEAVPK